MSQQFLKTDDAEEDAVAAASSTESLYLEDTYLLEASARIVRVTEEAQSKHGKHCVAVDRTVFHPQGGGQPSDKGSMVSYCSAGSGDEAKAFKVVFVRKAVDNDQVIEHIGDFCGPADWQGFLPGQQVLLKVDEVLKATKGYHFSDGPYVEYQGSISEAQLATLPVDLNNEMQRIIRESIPTTVELMDNASAGSVCGCDTSSYPPRVRVVSLAGVSIPCGGTHVDNTAALQGCVVLKIKKKKDTYRVSYSMMQ